MEAIGGYLRVREVFERMKMRFGRRRLKEKGKVKRYREGKFWGFRKEFFSKMWDFSHKDLISNSWKIEFWSEGKIYLLKNFIELFWGKYLWSFYLKIFESFFFDFYMTHIEFKKDFILDFFSLRKFWILEGKYDISRLRNLPIICCKN